MEHKDKHIVYLTEDGEIVGPDEVSLYSNLGILARNGYRAPLTYLSWTDVPINILDDLWREMQVSLVFALKKCEFSSLYIHIYINNIFI